MERFKSLRTKMTIMIVLVVLGSSVLLSFISYQRAKSSLIAQMKNNYAVAAQKYALELTSWVNTNATIIDTMAAEIAVNDISQKDYDEFHKYLKNSNELLNKNGYVYDVYFTYTDNFMVCASDFIADGTVDFVHEREWYTTSALTGELFFSAPYLDSDTKKPIITISKAVYKDGELLGVLAADIFVDVLVDMVKKADVEDNSYAFLIDQNMRMIVHPDEAYDYEDVPKNVMEVPDTPYATLVDSIYAGSDEMIFVTDYDKVTRGIVYSRMPNTGWYVCIATSRDELEKGIRSLMSGFLAATTVAVVIGVIVSFFLARVLDKLNRQEQEYKEQVLKLEKQAADEASEAKSRFLADMSHEIRTPINAIIGMNEMIFRESDDRNVLEYSRNIKQSGHNLLQLINGILDFSKIEDGKMEIVPVHYNVGSQMAYFVNSISERASAKDLQLILNIDPGLPSELYGDDTRINQIVMNLLTNAVKYTEKGSVTLTVEGRERRDNREILLYYEVKDTGIGIKESDMAKLFESFERLDVVRNRNIEGTGLGMTITRRLLELMGSELNVESKYGEGSVFSFELWQMIENDKPLGDYRETLKDSEETDTYKESFHAPDARILVVDDSNMNLFVIQNLLKNTGITIDTALSGAESVKLAAEKPYDVILMDQRMPEMDGTEAMKRIRSDDNRMNGKTPVICLTADVIMGAKERYLKQGFDDYLMKPVEGEMLEKMLMEYLPKDKIETGISSEKKTVPDISASDEMLMKALNEAGVDTEAGMKLMGNDENTYRMILVSFVLEAKTKSEKLKNSFEAKDWKNYGVYAHSLKSGARTIGASKLSELAAGLEAAAGSQDVETIEKDHEKVLEMYAGVVKAIKDNMGSKVPEVSENKDMILEFAPR